MRAIWTGGNIADPDRSMGGAYGRSGEKGGTVQQQKSRAQPRGDRSQQHLGSGSGQAQKHPRKANTFDFRIVERAPAQPNQGDRLT